MPAGKTVIEYKLDELRTPDGTKALAKNIFLRVRGPEKNCIVGINGVGKTTLLKLMAEDCPKLGVWITESEWGKGYAFEALNFIF